MDEKKQQFNVYLPPELVRAIKHAAIDRGQTLSDFVEATLRGALEADKAASEAAPKDKKDRKVKKDKKGK